MNITFNINELAAIKAALEVVISSGALETFPPEHRAHVESANEKFEHLLDCDEITINLIPDIELPEHKN